MPNGLIRELREVEPVALPERDVRAGRPVLRGILRFDTVRALTRIVTLGALDLAALFLAIYTALVVKSALTAPHQVSEMWGQAQEYFPLGGLVMLLLFARSGLYRERAQRPGAAKVISSLVEVTLVLLVYAVIEGENFQSYYIFYGSLFFALIYVSLLRWVFERVSGAVLRAAGYRRRAVLVGSGTNIQAVSHALRESREIEPYGFVARSHVALMDGLRDFRSLEQLERHFDSIDEVLIADPDFPQAEAVELVDRCHDHGVRVRVAPSTMEILMDRVEFVPGQALPLFELKPPVFEGVDFAIKRSFDLLVAVLLLIVLAPVLGVAALLIKLSSRGPVLYRSVRPGIGGRPFACLKFRTMVTDADLQQDQLESRNELSGAIFKIRDDPRITAGRPLPAALVARRAAPALQRRARRDVAGGAAPAPAARLRPPRRLAPQALPRAPGHDRAVAGVGTLRARLRRARPARLPLPRALVRLPRPDHPAQDDPRGHPGAGRLVS